MANSCLSSSLSQLADCKYPSNYGLNACHAIELALSTVNLQSSNKRSVTLNTNCLQIKDRLGLPQSKIVTERNSEDGV